MSPEIVSLERQDGVALITIRDPQVNVINAGVRAGMSPVLLTEVPRRVMVDILIGNMASI
jgi:enoyl-CoA hydratase/carnithine racemase